MSSIHTLVACTLLGTAAHAQLVERIGLTPEGQQVDGHALYFAKNSMSPDGRWMCFASEATNLMSGDTNGVADIFLLDRATGFVERQSVDPNGVQFPSATSYAKASADGSRVILATVARLTPDDVNTKSDLYIRHRSTGAFQRISQPGPGGSNSDHVITFDASDDLRWVYMKTRAQLDASDTNVNHDLYLRDTTLGTLVRVTPITGPTSVLEAATLSVSPDGRFVAFTSASSALVPGDTNNAHDAFAWDRHTGVLERVSVSSSGQQADADSFWPSISPDGRYVAFETLASTLVPGDGNGNFDVFVRDRVLQTTIRISLDSTGSEVAFGSSLAKFSRTGRWITFTSQGPLLPSDPPGFRQYLFDFANGGLRSVVPSWDGSPVPAHLYAFDWSEGDRFLFFAADAANLVPGDTNGFRDLFLADFGPGSTRTFCSGDGSASACPCGNVGGIGQGCANSTGRGARLAALGTPSVGADSLTLHLSGALSGPVVFLQGISPVAGGAGIAFQDGLRCVGGAILRLGLRQADHGVAALGADGGGPSIASIGQLPTSGGQRSYQAWYRNAADFCTPSSSNLSNGVEVGWIP